MVEPNYVISGFQGDRWGIVKDCTCLWSSTHGFGWQILADDGNCPAHHPASVKEAPRW